jgi:hypothetical protein
MARGVLLANPDFSAIKPSKWPVSDIASIIFTFWRLPVQELDTASAKFKSPHTGTFVFEASNVSAHIACEIRRVWHASYAAASDLVKRWQASSFLHWLE